MSAWLNWTATRVMIVLDGDRDDEQLEKARRNVPGLLVEPLLRWTGSEQFAAALVV